MILTTCNTGFDLYALLIASSSLGCPKRRRHAMCSRGAAENRQVMPDDHSELVPPLPIPNRTVKRLCADDSAATSVKVGHRQAVIQKTPVASRRRGFLLWDGTMQGAVCGARRDGNVRQAGTRLPSAALDFQNAQSVPGAPAGLARPGQARQGCHHAEHGKK